MKGLLIIVALAFLSGCAGMTPEQKRNTWMAVGAVVVTGAIIANESDSAAPPQGKCHVIVPPGVVEQRLC